MSISLDEKVKTESPKAKDKEDNKMIELTDELYKEMIATLEKEIKNLTQKNRDNIVKRREINKEDPEYQKLAKENVVNDRVIDHLKSRIKTVKNEYKHGTKRIPHTLMDEHKKFLERHNK